MPSSKENYSMRCGELSGKDCEGNLICDKHILDVLRKPILILFFSSSTAFFKLLHNYKTVEAQNAFLLKYLTPWDPIPRKECQDNDRKAKIPPNKKKLRPY